MRAPTDDDLLATCALLHAHYIAETGEPDTSDPSSIRNDWADLNRETDSWVVIAPDGFLCGYATITSEGVNQCVEDVYVHPLYQGKGIGSALIEVMEEHARQIASAQSKSPSTRLENSIIANSSSARSLLDGYGYTLARVYFRMHITLDEPPSLPQCPAGIIVRACDGAVADLQQGYAVIQDAFKDIYAHEEQTYANWTRRNVRQDFDPSLWLFTCADDVIVGAALGHRQEPWRGWIDLVGVRRDWRKRGIAMALLRLAFGAFYACDVQRIGLGVDGQSLTGAQHLYECAGMAVTMHIGAYEKYI